MGPAAPGGRGPLPHLLCIVAGDLGDGLECLVHGLEGVTELAEGVVVVIDRARPGWRLSPGWRLFFLAPSFLGKLFRAAADRRRGPSGSLKNRKARTSPTGPKYTPR